MPGVRQRRRATKSPSRVDDLRLLFSLAARNVAAPPMKTLARMPHKYALQQGERKTCRLLRFK